MYSKTIKLDTQSDIVKFVEVANTIKGTVTLGDDTYNKVNAKSIMGCLYSLEFAVLHVYVEDQDDLRKFDMFAG